MAKTKKKRLSHQFRGDCAEFFFHGQRTDIQVARDRVTIALIDRYGLPIVKRHADQLTGVMNRIEREYWYG